jgi:hypothetical protein
MSIVAWRNPPDTALSCTELRLFVIAVFHETIGRIGYDRMNALLVTNLEPGKAVSIDDRRTSHPKTEELRNGTMSIPSSDQRQSSLLIFTNSAGNGECIAPAIRSPKDLRRI